MPSGEHDRHWLDITSAGTRRLLAPGGEHLLIDRGGTPVRLDIIEGSTTAGPVALHFDLADDEGFDDQITAIRRLRAAQARQWHHAKAARRLVAIHAADARAGGASLREIAELLLGPGDWPGDGEHRKSMVRRMVVRGVAMLRAGAPAVLMDRGL